MVDRARQFQITNSLKGKFALILLLSIAMPLLVVSYFSYTTTARGLFDRALISQSNELDRITTEIHNALREVPKDLRFLSEFYTLTRYLQWSKLGETQRIDKWQKRVTDAFISFLESKEVYAHIRLIGNDGHETIRVNYLRESGKTEIIDTADLQDKSNSSYYKVSKHLKRGEFYFSEMDLNQEQGRVTNPQTPVIRIATPVIDSDGERHGVLILNMFASNLLDIIKSSKLLLSGLSDDVHRISLINQDGHYLHHPNPVKTFAWQLKREDSLIKDDKETFELISHREKGTITTDESIITFRSIDIMPGNIQQRWYLLMRSDKGVILEPITRYTVIVAASTLLTLLLVLLITRIYTNRIAVALSKVAQELKQLSVGILPDSLLHYPGDDEVKEIVDSTMQLKRSLKRTITHAELIANEDYSNDIEINSERDQLGNAINDMTRVLRTSDSARQLMVDRALRIAQGDFSETQLPSSLQKSRLGEALQEMTRSLRASIDKAEQLNWLQTGVSTFNESIREDLLIEELGEIALTAICRYLPADVGVIYHSEDNENFYRIATHACTTDSVLAQFTKGTGVLGQTVVDKEASLLTQLPAGVLTIRTGLSNGDPQSIYIAPLIYLDEVIGVIELGSTGVFNEQKIAYVDAILDALAIALNSSQNRTQTDELLRTMQKQTRELEQANRYKSEFLATMSHEIRTPMNGILGMSELLLKSSLNDSQYSYAKAVYNSGESLLSILNDILDLSKIEAGKLDLEKIGFNVEELVFNIIDAFSTTAHQKNIEMVVRFIPSEFNPLIMGDPVRIRQVLVNLIGNAVKFTDEGQIAIVISVVKEDATNVTLKFEVKDTGIGIAPKVLEHLFEPFVQADGSTTRKYGGSGLGLTIVESLIDMMNGTLGVESRPDEGSNFWFQIDFNKQDRPYEVTESTVEYSTADDADISPALNGKRVLVIDDHPINRELLSDQLNALSMNVSVASSGHQGLMFIEQSILDSAPYELVLLDYLMPSMDGTEVSRVMSKSADMREIPVIVLASSNFVKDVNQDINCNVCSVLTKPIRFAELKIACYRAIKTEVASLTEIDTTEEPLVSEHDDAVGHSIKVLVAEDVEINQMVITSMLEQKGFEVVCVENGIKALTALDHEKFDVILMDCHMPDMDGFEATQKIRDRSGEDANIPIIAVTADAMKEDRDRCISCGMNDYISKPYKGDDIVDLILRWVAPDAANGQAGPLQFSALPTKQQDSLEDTTLVFDQEAMSERLMGDSELIRTIAEAFLADMDEQLEQLREHIQSNDVEKAAVQSHKIKGAAANVGGVALSMQAAIMEKAGKADDFTTVLQELPELERCFIQLKMMMEQKIFEAANC